MDELVVIIGGRVAGRIGMRSNALLRFEYDDGYRETAAATPLSLSMPLAVRVTDDTAARRTVTNFLQGLLPDDDVVRRRWADFFRVRANHPFYLLATPVGHDCAGAVSFCPADKVGTLLARQGRVDPLSEADVASLLRDLGRDRTMVLGARFEGQFSLAGAQAKIALVCDAEGRWGRPSGIAATNRILKPAAAGWTDQDVNEHLCLAAAGRAGLTVARSEVLRFEDQEAIVSHRYDRFIRPGDAFYRRVHQEDLCQALGLGPDRKYESQGGPSARDVAALLRRAMPAAAAERDVRAFADALAWNWLVAGTDNHAKNYSVLLAGADVRLAPLYDISSILPYLGTRSPMSGEVIHERDTGSAMRIGGHYEYVPIRDSWPRAARDLGLHPDELVDRVRDLSSRVADAFRDAAADPGIASLQRRISATLVDRVADRARRCRAVLG